MRYQLEVETDMNSSALLMRLGKMNVTVKAFGEQGAVFRTKRNPKTKPAPAWSAEGFGSGHEARRARTAERNKKIIAEYQAGDSSVVLEKRYGISRERICQILRVDNVIGNAQARKEAAKEALSSATSKLKAETAALWDSKLKEALDLVKAGSSCRSAATQVGMKGHSQFTSLLGKRARAEGMVLRHGPQQNWDKRKERVVKLWDKGYSIPQIVRKLRETTEPTINDPWVYRTFPSFRVRDK